ncbi:tyrosine-type recombinase/integrase [Nonomuraea sp. NPDC052129]|uniref:tyrosine-type recombinase/integrase n=1 Tax=Nonomuraea sp. NPDC052129 TaxID=3154651 RepID=UPI003425BBD6
MAISTIRTTGSIRLYLKPPMSRRPALYPAALPLGLRGRAPIRPAARSRVSSLFPILIKRNNAQNPNTPLPKARLHDLRHIHATTLLLAGVPVHIVAARLGHADPSITLRVYAHVIRAAEASAADVFAQAINE